MTDIDEIMNDISNEKKENKAFDRNEVWNKMQEERKEIFNLIDKTADEVRNDIGKYKSYLTMQGKLDKYSVANTLAILAQKPNARKLKSFKYWNENGALIKESEKAIKILEVNSTYTSADGSVKPSWKVKKLFDISQTNSTEEIKDNNIEEKRILTALLKDSPVDIKVVDYTLDLDKSALWKKEDNTLYIKSGIETPIAFREISRELAKAALDDSGDKQLIDFKSNSVSYMLCVKYGIDVSNINLNSIPEQLRNMNTKDFKKELNSCRSTMEDINDRMNAFFDYKVKLKKAVEQER